MAPRTKSGVPMCCMNSLTASQMTPNKQLQRTWQSVTHFARAKCAPLCHAAELRRYAATRMPLRRYQAWRDPTEGWVQYWRTDWGSSPPDMGASAELLWEFD